MTRVAAIDCGTNSIRLLIAEPDGSGGLKDLERRLEVVRLGQGVDATGEFHPDALERTFAAVDQYVDLINKWDIIVEHTHFVATSATRDVMNRDTFFAGIMERLGVLPDVISGETEARLSFNGALSRVTPRGEPVLVMDIGGGSTELITGSVAVASPRMGPPVVRAASAGAGPAFCAGVLRGWPLFPTWPAGLRHPSAPARGAPGGACHFRGFQRGSGASAPGQAASPPERLPLFTRYG